MTDVPIDELRDLIAEWDDIRQEFADGEVGYNDGLAEGARSAAQDLALLIDRYDTVLTHMICTTCASDADAERPHEVLTDSEYEAALFRMAHGGHDVREAVVDV